MKKSKHYSIIVIGGGHAGTEAALASARMGVKTLLVTHNIETLGQMSCNPAIGGIGKGHLVKEIDAMGGVMACAIDKSGIQFRTLNASKGSAVRAIRAQADRVLYKAAIRSVLENQENLSLFQQSVEDLIIENDVVKGVQTQISLSFTADKVILTSGTFLGGVIHIGQSNYEGGRAGDAPSSTLSKRLRGYDLGVGRLKTGTPPRLDGRTIDFSVLQKQSSDTPLPTFSFMGNVSDHPAQIPCYITYTNKKTHDFIRSGLDQSPMFTGNIQGIGPRYCPSIEDKVVRFSERDSHQIFVEPEGLTTNEIYPNGVSTSLPYEVQQDFIHSIKGFENAHIVRHGYAIEYDFFDPRGLRQTLEVKKISGLYFAGQINGTTGYEEAAAQGLLAGVNAACSVLGKNPWLPKRDDSYIGVMVDDLITKGTNEPYRMFTSRAEYRLLLRGDNADERLTPKGRELGLVNDERWVVFEAKYIATKKEKQRLKNTWIQANDIQAGEVLGQSLAHEYSLLELLKRPQINYQILSQIESGQPFLTDTTLISVVENQIKYAGYIKRQLEEIEKYRKHENTTLPNDMDYGSIKALSSEVIQQLNEHRPETIGQASRMQGVTPASISILLVYLKIYKKPLSNKTLLLNGAKQMNIELSDTQVLKLLEYLALINKWNKTYNLSSIYIMAEGVKQHLLDSLSIMPFVKDTPLLDVGSGAGLPGIVIAIMKPNISVSVIDTVGKKCRFMQFVKAQLGLKNLSVINERVEVFKPNQCFRHITSRAFAKTNKTLKLTQHLLCDNGNYLLMKGANIAQEVLPQGTTIHQLCVSDVSNERFLLEIRRKE